MKRCLTKATLASLSLAALLTLTSNSYGQFDLGRVIGGIAEGAARETFGGNPIERVQGGFTERVQGGITERVQSGFNDRAVREIASAAVQILSNANSAQYHNDYCDGRGSVRKPIVRPETGSPAEQAFLKAQAALKNRNYVSAVTHAEKAAELLPENHDIQQLRSLIYFAQGRYKESASVAYQALHLGPGWNWKTILKVMGKTESEASKHYQESYQVLAKAAKNNPDSVDYHFLLGYHYLMLGHKEAGQKELMIVDRLIPGDRLVTNILGALSADRSVASK